MKSYAIVWRNLEIWPVRKNNMENIHIGQNLLSKLEKLISLNNFSRIVILTDTHVAKNWLPVLKNNLKGKALEIIIKPGEKQKNIQTLINIWQKFVEMKLDRKSLLINLGGGVISDIGGFAASTYLRGINYLQIPTTLLSQIDASIGGKTGINFKDIKNILGVFNQPLGVVIDIDTLETLPKRQFLSGWAEIIKHAIIADMNYLNLLNSKSPQSFSKNELLGIIKRSCEIKSTIVRRDRKEQGLRKVLNYGHSLGHALEIPLLHGEAVAVGMIGEAKLAHNLGLLSKENFQLIETTVKNAGLPVRVSGKSRVDILSLLQFDKKNEFGKINWSLPKKIGQMSIDNQATKKQIIEAINYITE